MGSDSLWHHPTHLRWPRPNPICGHGESLMIWSGLYTLCWSTREIGALPLDCSHLLHEFFTCGLPMCNIFSSLTDPAWDCICIFDHLLSLSACIYSWISYIYRPIYGFVGISGDLYPGWIGHTVRNSGVKNNSESEKWCKITLKMCKIAHSCENVVEISYCFSATVEAPQSVYTDMGTPIYFLKKTFPVILRQQFFTVCRRVHTVDVNFGVLIEALLKKWVFLRLSPCL